MGPLKANAVLVVDTDAVLSQPVTFQRFETIGRRCAQIVEILGIVQHAQLAACHRLD